MRFKIHGISLIVLLGGVSASALADNIKTTTRPTSDEVNRRIAAVQSIIDACKTEAGASGEPLIDYAAGTVDSISRVQKRDYAGATELARKSTDKLSGQQQVQTLVGFCLAVGDIEGANQLIVSSGFPATPQQYYEVAKASLHFGDRAAAQAAVDAGLDAAKKNPPPANHAFEQAQFDSAVTQLKMVMNSSPRNGDLQALAQLAEQARRTGNREQLIAYDKQAIGLVDQVPDTATNELLLLGEIFSNTNDRDRATRTLQRIEASHPRLNLQQRQRLLQLRADSGLDLDDNEIKAVNDAYAKMRNARAQPGPEIELQLAEACLNAGNKKEAARLAGTCQDQIAQSPAPSNQSGLLKLAGLIAPADPAAGLKLFDQVIELSARLGDGRDPLPQKTPSPEMEKQAREFYSIEQFVTLINVAKQELVAGMPDEAKKRLNEGMAGLKPLLPKASTMGGTQQIVNGCVAEAALLAELGQPDAAIDAYNELIASDASTPAAQRFTGLPTSTDNLLAAIARIQLEQHRNSDAAASVARIDPKTRPWVAVAIGQDMLKAGDLDTATSVADSIPDPDPNAFGLEPVQKPTLLNAIAKARLSAGDKTRAADLAKKSLNLLVHFREQNVGLPSPQPREMYVNPDPNSRITIKSCAVDAFTMLCAAAGAEQAVGGVAGELEISAAIGVLCDQGRVDLAKSLIDKIPSNTRGQQNSEMPKAICLEQLAIAELNQGDRAGFDRDALAAAEMVDTPGQETTYDITIPLAAALDKKGDSQGAEMLRAAAVRRMLTGGDAQQPTMMMERLIKVEVLPERGPSSAYFLIEAAPTAPLRAHLLATLATELTQELIAGQNIPSVDLKKPSLTASTAASMYRGKSIDQWAAELVANSKYGSATQALIHLGPAVGPVMAKVARDHADNDQLCEQVVFVLRDSGSDPGYVIDLTNATGQRTQSLATATVQIWGVDCVGPLLDRIDKAQGADRACLIRMLSQGTRVRRIALQPIPNVDINPNPPTSAFVLTGKKCVTAELTKRLVDLVNHTDDIDTKRLAMTALAGYCDASGVPALESALSETDLHVRNSACLGLARLARQAGDAIATLQKLPADDPLSSRAQWCIRRIQGTEPEPEQ